MWFPLANTSVIKFHPGSVSVNAVTWQLFLCSHWHLWTSCLLSGNVPHSRLWKPSAHRVCLFPRITRNGALVCDSRLLRGAPGSAFIICISCNLKPNCQLLLYVCVCVCVFNKSLQELPSLALNPKLDSLRCKKYKYCILHCLFSIPILWSWTFCCFIVITYIYLELKINYLY